MPCPLVLHLPALVLACFVTLDAHRRPPAAAGVAAAVEHGVVQPSPIAVDINTADAEELRSVKGIGPVLSSRIVEYRRQHGPFDTVEQLTGVRGIGKKTVEKLRQQLAVRPPPGRATASP